MAKTKAQKKGTIESLTTKLKNFKSAVFIDYRGLTVAEASAIRKLCKQQGAEYIVAKKTLLKLALDEVGLKDMDIKNLQGNIAIIIGFEDEVAPAKVAANFAKDHKSLKLLGGVMESEYIDLAKVEALSLIPSRPELLAKLVGSINAPVSGFVNVLAGNIRNLLNVLNALQKAKS
jgi:large subunit ribosomal protein L10